MEGVEWDDSEGWNICITSEIKDILLLSCLWTGLVNLMHYANTHQALITLYEKWHKAPVVSKVVNRGRIASGLAPYCVCIFIIPVTS